MKYNKSMQKKAAKSPAKAKTSSRTSTRRPAPKKREKKLSRDDLVRENTKRHKRRHKKNYILYYILLFLLLLTVGITLSLTVFFNIERFEVVGGNSTLPEEQIIADTGIQLGQNLFRVSTDRAERAIIKNNINLDDVKIVRALPSTLRIELEPSEVAAVVYTDGKYYSLSRGERIVRVTEQYDEKGVPLVMGCDFSEEQLGGYVAPNSGNKLETLLAVLDAIRVNEAQEKISCIDLESIMIIRMYYGENTELKFDGIANLDFELSRVLELFAQGRVDPDDYQTIDATTASENAHYFVLPLESSPLPAGFRQNLNGTEDLLLGHDLPPEQLPPDLSEPADGDTEPAAE